jgi:hypothetical protein
VEAKKSLEIVLSCCKQTIPRFHYLTPALSFLLLHYYYYMEDTTKFVPTRNPFYKNVF